MFITHILACISVGIIFRFWKYGKNKNYNNQKKFKTEAKYVSFSNLGEVLSKSITNAINSIVMIGGFVVLFSVIISVLKQSHILDITSNFLKPLLSYLHIKTEFAKPILGGLIELTNGVKEVSQIATKDISTNIIICAFLLGFGGISILLQVFSITSKTDISIKPYILGKLIQGCLAAFYTYIIIKNVPIFNIDLSPAFNTSSSNTYIFLLIIFIIISLILKHFVKKAKNI